MSVKKMTASVLAFIMTAASSGGVWAENAATSTAAATNVRIKQELKDDAGRRDREAVLATKEAAGKTSVLDEAEFAKYDNKPLVDLKTVAFNDSSIFSKEELQAICRPFVGTKVSLRDLYKMTALINIAYRDRGAVAAMAVLPEQDVTTGAVKIELVEGRVGELSVSGVKHTKPAFVTKRLRSQSGDLVDSRQFERDLTRINALYDIPSKVALAPGKTFGTTDVDVQVQEPQNLTAMVFTDNAGKDDIGLYRYGVVTSDRSVFGIRDAFTLGTVGSQGMQNAFLSYGLPLNRWGTRFLSSFDYSRTNVIAGDLADLDVIGTYYGGSGRLTQPVYVSQTAVSSLYSEYALKHSTSAFGGNTTFDTKITDYTLGCESMVYGEKSVTNYDAHVISGKDRNASNTYRTYNLSADQVRSTWGTQRLTMKARLQLASSDLIPSSEQYQLGGSATIRGYTEGLLVGDNGYLTGLEYDIALGKALRPFVFVDHGQIMKYRGDVIRNSNMHSLTSAGFGTQIAFAKYFSGKVTYAMPLIDHPYEEHSGPKALFYFQLVF